MQALIHSYLSFLEFLNYVIHFCKFPWENLMEKYFKLTNAFSSIYLQLVQNKSLENFSLDPKFHNLQLISKQLYIMVFGFATSYLT